MRNRLDVSLYNTYLFYERPLHIRFERFDKLGVRQRHGSCANADKPTLSADTTYI